MLITTETMTVTLYVYIRDRSVNNSKLRVFVFFFFQAEDGIRDAQESRGLGDVYKRQDYQGISR